jgi:hypothetical protein
MLLGGENTLSIMTRHERKEQEARENFAIWNADFEARMARKMALKILEPVKPERSWYLRPMGMDDYLEDRDVKTEPMTREERLDREL